MAESVLSGLEELKDGLRLLQDQLDEVSRVQQAVTTFNSTFGNFLQAIVLQGSCLRFPQHPPPKKSTSALADTAYAKSMRATKQKSPQTYSKSDYGEKEGKVDTDEDMEDKSKHRTPPSQENRRTKSLGRKSIGTRKSIGRKSLGSKSVSFAKRQSAASPSWKWDKDMIEKLPRKYQTKDQLHKMETLILYLKNRDTGVTIADLARNSGMKVIRCKETLQTLMKVNLVERSFASNTGYVYNLLG